MLVDLSTRAAFITALTLTHTALAVAAPSYVVENYGIAQALTTEPGNAARGKEVLVDRDLGNCLGCHAAPIDAEFFGTTGPTLAGVGARLNAAQLRLRLVDPKQLNPMTIMPAYYKTDGLNRVLKEFAGKPILTAQQIEDVVAFLLTLNEAP